MKWGPQDRWVCIILPPLLTAALLFRVLLRPLLMDVSALRASIPGQRALILPPETMDQFRAEQRQLEQTMAGEQRQVEAAEAVFKKNCAENRVLTLQAIARLCESAGLTLLAMRKEDQAECPQVLQSLAQTLKEQGSAPAPQFWRLDLQGSYANMVRILDALSTMDRLVIPISLSMEPGKNGNGAALWTLALWI